MKKHLVAIIVPFILFLGVAAGNIETWKHPHLWLIFAIVVAAGIWQPAYNPADTGAPAHDRSTAKQIVWTVYSVLIVSVVEAAYFRYPESLIWDEISTIALIVALAGLGLRTWAVVTLGRHFTWHITVFDDHKVVTNGPYRFVRHPSYTGAWMLYSAIPLMLHSWFGFALSVVFQFFAYSRRIKHEEGQMTGKLGAAYADYARTVKTLIPYVW